MCVSQPATLVQTAVFSSLIICKCNHLFLCCTIFRWLNQSGFFDMAVSSSLAHRVLEVQRMHNRKPWLRPSLYSPIMHCSSSIPGFFQSLGTWGATDFLYSYFRPARAFTCCVYSWLAPLKTEGLWVIDTLMQGPGSCFSQYHFFCLFPLLLEQYIFGGYFPPLFLLAIDNNLHSASHSGFYRQLHLVFLFFF